ncbi:hypothetical protein SGR_3458 [Streptomyces griseus subsp. griseus NBRC 13350]|uniref:Uncharacterized protein n=1 Tax=Streptomyces griseus subsp. griseus (strain JCM 4626 / CBS 651.72 / NBRC 13350 / KCC S-0626 / ISP 5235) TaxID=455632 RepID=B1VMH7_STRGG|nr:hypothetical protein SGR_3458 [Streptomyces griseus subsp. griseus NBRC 13350]
MTRLSLMRTPAAQPALDRTRLRRGIAYSHIRRLHCALPFSPDHRTGGRAKF